MKTLKRQASQRRSKGHAVSSFNLEVLEDRLLMSGGQGADVTASLNALVKPSALTASDWTYHRTLTIDHTKVVANQGNFPVLVDFTDAGLASHALTDGSDIVFTGSDGVTKLNHEIESYNAATGHLVAWVNVPVLSSTTDTVLNMYYGNPASGKQQNPAGVWDSGYVSVQHLEEKSGAALDSTANGLNGTVSAGVTEGAAGLINGAFTFDGVNGRVVMPRVFSQKTFTIEGWVNTAAKQGYIAGQRDAAGNGVLLQYYAAAKQFQFYVGGVKLSVATTENSWHYVAATYDGTTARLYEDGKLAASAVTALTMPNVQMILGDSSAANRKFKGQLDELRFSNVARSAGYLQVAMNSERYPAGFVWVGPEQVSGLTIVNQTPTDGASGIPATLDHLTFEIKNPSGGPVSYTVITTPNIGSASATGVAPGVFQVPISGLIPDTRYTWVVQASDGTNTTTEAFSFTVGLGWDLQSWQYRQTVTIQHSQVVADQAGFPVLIDVTNAGLVGKAQADGRDIIFVGADAKTPLNYEIESYDPATGHLVAWVSTDVSSTQDTQFYMYYGNPSTNLTKPTGPQALWDKNFVSVLHLNDASGVFNDSTGNGNAGHPVNGVTYGAAGQIDGGAGFDGTNGRIEMSPVFQGTGAFTVEGWIFTGSTQEYLFSQQSPQGFGSFLQYYPNTSQFEFHLDGTKLIGRASQNAWHYFAGTFDGTTGRLFVDGQLTASAPATNTWPSQDTTLGDSQAGGRSVLGTMDEIRMSNIARSAAYIQTSYLNQCNSAAFVTLGDAQAPAGSVIVSDVSPADLKRDVGFNPTLSATIQDMTGSAFDYTIDILINSTWVTVASATGVTGPVTVNAPTTGVTGYSTDYVWRVVAGNLTEGYTERDFRFTTRQLGNYLPVISNPSPVSGGVDSAFHPTLSATVTDMDGDLLDITFSVLDNQTNTWKTVGSYQDVPGGTYTADTGTWATAADTKYTWQVTVSDHKSAQPATQTNTFTTGNDLDFKWAQQLDITGTVEGQYLPVIGDVDGDGYKEVIITAGDNLYCLNGQTGAVKWTVAGESREVTPALADLNNDGIPEILYGLDKNRVRAVKGDGSILWTTSWLAGDDFSLCPILAYDVNGSGHPNIYVTTAYSGKKGLSYTGNLFMLDSNGNQLAHTWLFHPCWGGAAIGYVGGKFILFVSDRRNGYSGVTSHGLAAYDATTLATLWTRPDIHHSSPIPILADWNHDGKLELIAQRIVDCGPMILDPLTGKTLKDYSSMGLPTHGTATVYDIDEDGNLEMIMATGYPAGAPMDFYVFDLTTGKTEFHPKFTYHTAWPPRVADINGDGHMEILAAMGDQSNINGTFPLLVYNYKYQLIDTIQFPAAGQLTSTVVADLDNDGKQEMIVSSRSGRFYAYDLQANTPNPAPRADVPMYSEYRQNAAVYVAPPGPDAPKIWQENIADGATNLGLGPTLSVRCHDYQLEPMDITFELGTLVGTTWVYQTVDTYADVKNGTYTADTTGYVTKGNTKYQWRVTAVDSTGHTSQRTLSFTTAGIASWGQAAWLYRKRVSINHNLVSGSLSNYGVLVDVTSSQFVGHAQDSGNDFVFTDSTGQNKLSHEIESYDPVTGHLVAWVKVPSLSSTADTVLYLYYGNAAAANQQNVAGVWDANYLAVQHLEETSGPAVDSSSNGANAQPQNGVTQGVTAKIGSGYSFDGVDDRLLMPQIYSTQTAFSIEGWFNPAAQQGYVVDQLYSGNLGVLLQYYAASNQFQFMVNGAKVVAAATANSWHYVVATFSGGTVKLYVDGRAAVTTPGTLTWPTVPLYVGGDPLGGRAFSGLMDELRFSNVDRGQNYALTTYNNEVNAAGFAVVAGEEQKS